MLKKIIFICGFLPWNADSLAAFQSTIEPTTEPTSPPIHVLGQPTIEPTPNPTSLSDIGLSQPTIEPTSTPTTLEPTSKPTLYEVVHVIESRPTTKTEQLNGNVYGNELKHELQYQETHRQMISMQSHEPVYTFFATTKEKTMSQAVEESSIPPYKLPPPMKQHGEEARATKTYRNVVTRRLETEEPTAEPTSEPTKEPSAKPSVSTVPSTDPSSLPSLEPSTMPSLNPSSIPSTSPSSTPSSIPSIEPSSTPSNLPSSIPSSYPSLLPSSQPYTEPSNSPTSSPSYIPSLSPSNMPSLSPSETPSVFPSFGPSAEPSSLPSGVPYTSPSSSPSMVPSTVPSTKPSTLPSLSPSNVMSLSPTISSAPSSYPSSIPTDVPSSLPSAVPSSEPTVVCEEDKDDVFAYEYKKENGVIIGVAPKKCSWLANKDVDRIAEICSNEVSFEDILRAFDVCVITCGRCVIEPTQSPSVIPSTSPSDSPSLEPSSMPSMSPSVSPSSVPSTSPSVSPSSDPTIFWECEENSNMEFAFRYIYDSNDKIIGVKKRTCGDLAAIQDPAKRYNICDPERDINYNELKSAWDTCFITCGRCEIEVPSQAPSVIASSNPSLKPSAGPSASPSLKPSFGPSLKPSFVATTLPSLSSAPSSIPSLLPSLTPSSPPTTVPSSSPSSIPSAVPSNVPTKSCQDFDGQFGASGKLTCEKIRKYVTEKRQRSCSKSRIYEICPLTCGICCRDDEKFIFTHKNRERDCVWLAGQTQNKIENLCDQYGNSIQYGCIETCGYCFPFPFPTVSPTTAGPTKEYIPSTNPSLQPLIQPSIQPSANPSLEASAFPSFVPSLLPSIAPSSLPSTLPSLNPSTSRMPSSNPSLVPSLNPSDSPSIKLIPATLSCTFCLTMPGGLFIPEDATAQVIGEALFFNAIGCEAYPDSPVILDIEMDDVSVASTVCNSTTIDSRNVAPQFVPVVSIEIGQDHNPATQKTAITAQFTINVPSDSDITEIVVLSSVVENLNQTSDDFVDKINEIDNVTVTSIFDLGSEPILFDNCVEDPDGIFALRYETENGNIIGVVEKTCSWLVEKKTDERIAQICADDISYEDVASTWDVCVVTCGRCIAPPSSSPSASPSQLASSLPSASPSRTVSLAPTFFGSVPGSESSVPSVGPTSSPSQAVSLEPTFFGSVPGSESSVPSIIPTIVSSFAPSSGPSSSSLPSTVQSSEPTIVCEEDKNDVFASEYKKENGVIIGVVTRKCSWLAKKNTNRITDICSNDVTFGGVLPAFDVCVITCGRCEIDTTPSPTVVSIQSPTNLPSLEKFSVPSKSPSVSPSSVPSLNASSMPSKSPSVSPSFSPSSRPTIKETTQEPSAIQSSPIPSEPTTTPSVFVTPTTTLEPVFFVKVDSEGNAVLRDCLWLSDKSEFKQKQICASSYTIDDYSSASETCPEICDVFSFAPTPFIPCPKIECTNRPDKFFFKFSGGSCDDSDNSQGSKFTCSDNGDGVLYKSRGYFLEFTDKKEEEVYFSGFRYIGSEFELLPESSKFPADMIVNVYTGSDKSTLEQSLMYHSSCSQNLFTGDVFGAVTLVGFLSDTQDEQCCNPESDPGCTSPESPDCNEECTKRPDSFFFQLTGGECEDSVNSQASDFSFDSEKHKDYFVCEDIGSSVKGTTEFYVEFTDDKDDEIFYSGFVNVDEVVELTPEKDKFSANMNIKVDNKEMEELQKVTFHSSCSKNLAVGDSFGAVTLVGFKSTSQDVFCPIEE